MHFVIFYPKYCGGSVILSYTKIAQSLDGFQIILQNLGIITTTPSEWAAEKLVTCIMIILGLIFVLGVITALHNKNKPSKPVGNNYQKDYYEQYIEGELNGASNAIKELRAKVDRLQTPPPPPNETDEAKLIRLKKQIEILENQQKKGNDTNENF